MSTLASELDLPELPFVRDDDYREALRRGKEQGHWLFRSLTGYVVASYDDALARLRSLRDAAAAGDLQPA